MVATTKLIKIGDRFGRLTVVEAAPKKPTRSTRRWLCLCDCGGSTTAETATLRSGHSSSCGCLQRERARAAAKITSRKHGESKSPEWVAWHGMRARCKYPSSKDYHLYGGRGISVASQWEDYETFLKDVGRRPSPEHSLDRLDSNKGYEPGNVKWSTKLEQANNRRDNIRVCINGVDMTLRNAIREAGNVISVTGATRRLRKGMRPDIAVSLPPRGGQ